MTAPVYELRGVTRTRAKSGVAFTLEVPELIVRSGEFVAVVGESGCGKSTLLDLLALVLRPQAAERFQLTRRDGSVASLERAPGEAVAAALRASEIGYVLQTGGLLPFLSVRKNIALPARIARRALPESALRALAERLGIASQLDKLPAALSGGQRQRAAIARALAHRPPVILADEPTGAVDEKIATEIMEIFRELCRESGTTLVVVTHHLALVRERADRFFGFRLQIIEPQHTRSVCHETGRP